MSDPQSIKSALDRNIQALRLRPAVGCKTVVSRARVREGLACDVEEGKWKLTADLSPVMAGNAEGPDPGVLGRAALGSCLAMGYVLWAAQLEIPLDGVEVEVQADFDSRGQFGWDEIPAGYTEMRYHVSLSTKADEADIERLTRSVEANSSYLDVFRRAIKVVGSVSMSGKSEA